MIINTLRKFKFQYLCFLKLSFSLQLEETLVHMFIEIQITTSLRVVVGCEVSEKSHPSHVNWDKHPKLIRTRLKPNISYQ